ncbi:MAG: YraN family protein [Phycisphaeraceae bacterium]|nr:YraN family protein [Phycisphaeraceae bacterium]MCW5762739.1 YraN family protein [Phycisphaeraceae bacterium]
MNVFALLRRLGRAGPDSGALGRAGEVLAAQYMRSQGYRVLGQNLRVTAGEADLLCEDPRTNGIVLVEVKTRRREQAALDRHAPEVAINARKRARLLAIAKTMRRSNAWFKRPMRIDVIAIDYIQGQPEPHIRHHVNAVQDR